MHITDTNCYFNIIYSRSFAVRLYHRYIYVYVRTSWQQSMRSPRSPQEILQDSSKRRGVKKLPAPPTMSWQWKHDVPCTTTAAEWSIESRTRAWVSRNETRQKHHSFCFPIVLTARPRFPRRLSTSAPFAVTRRAAAAAVPCRLINQMSNTSSTPNAHAHAH